MTEALLTRYIQELTNQRTQLEFNILQLQKQIEDLKNATKQEGTDKTESPQ